MRLLEFCECFSECHLLLFTTKINVLTNFFPVTVLKNMVALLSYNDSAVKRLLMGKKMQGNHDVLAGLKSTLKKQLSPPGVTQLRSLEDRNC